jgi:hypothetical protein
VSENRELRKIFGTRGAKIIGAWRKLPIRFQELCFSANIIIIVNSRNTKCKQYEANMKKESIKFFFLQRM